MVARTLAVLPTVPRAALRQDEITHELMDIVIGHSMWRTLNAVQASLRRIFTCWAAAGATAVFIPDRCFMNFRLNGIGPSGSIEGT